MDRTKSTQPANVIYSPPAPKVLKAFAREVCQQMGSDYTEKEVLEGFSEFIKVAAQIQTKYLNKQNHARVDNAE